MTHHNLMSELRENYTLEGLYEVRYQLARIIEQKESEERAEEEEEQ